MKLIYEGVFRRPRLWSNEELKQVAHLFSGSVVNVSGWRDLDKNVGYRQYILGDYDGGTEYESYFENADEYYITNYPEDDDRGSSKKTNEIQLDLEKKLPEDLIQRFDVVYNHTTLEHVLDVFQAFENLCAMSSDVVIITVPFIQRVHDYQGSYEDYWRLTPFAIDRLFEENGFTVLYRSSNSSISSSIYYFYIATRNPNKWEDEFEIVPIEKQINELNTGRSIPIIASIHLRLERLLRKVAAIF